MKMVKLTWLLFMLASVTMCNDKISKWNSKINGIRWFGISYIYMQHNIVINSSMFQVTIAVRPITLVIGSYEDEAGIETLRKLGFGYRTVVAKFPEKGWNLFSVKAICKRVDKRGSATERKPGSGRRKQHELRKMLDTLLLISENRTLTLMLSHFTKY